MCSKYKILQLLFKFRPELKFGQEVLHGDLQTLHYDLVDMNKPSPKIKEVREFQR
jgi:hypothetical protein